MGASEGIHGAVLPHRTFEVGDAFADVAGIIAGIAAWRAWNQWQRRQE